jgi:tetratricopeptide (TPR) repeat protein
VTVSALALAVLIAGGAYSVQRIVAERKTADARRADAEVARADSDRRRAAAQELIDFMLVELRKKLAPIGKLSLLEGVGESVRAYYDAVGSDVDLDASPKDLDNRAAALRLLGDVLSGKDSRENAMRSYDAARVVLEHRIAVAPDVDASLALAATHRQIGELQRDLGKLDEARASCDQARAIVEGLVAASPDRTDLRREQANLTGAIALIQYAAKDVKGAVASIGDAATILRALVKDHPEEPQNTTMLAGTLADTAQYQLALGAPDAALTASDEAVSLMESAGEASKTPEYLDKASKYRMFHAMLRQKLGDIAAWKKELAELLALRRRLHDLDPENTTWGRDLGIALLFTGEQNNEDKDYRGALAVLEEAEALFRDLIAKDPNSVQLLLYPATIDGDLGTTHAQLGDDDEAVRYLKACVEDSRVYNERNGKPHGRDAYVSTCDRDLGDLENRRKNLDAAAAAYQDAIALAESEVQAKPGDAYSLHSAAVLYERLGKLRRAQGDTAAAAEAFRKEVAALEPLKDGKDPKFANAYADKCAVVAELLAPTDPAGARAFAEKARATLDALIAAGTLSDEGKSLPADVDKLLAELK